MQITTSKGKKLDVNWIWGPLRGTNQLMIDMTDDRTIREIAQDFEGVDKITKTDERRGVEEVYSGYTEIVGIIRERATSTVRITMEMP